MVLGSIISVVHGVTEDKLPFTFPLCQPLASSGSLPSFPAYLHGSRRRRQTWHQQEGRRAHCSLCVIFFQSEPSFSRHHHRLVSHESEPSLMPNLSQPLAKGIKDVTRVGDRRERHKNENQGIVSMEGSEMPIQLSNNNVSPSPRYPPSPG